MSDLQKAINAMGHAMQLQRAYYHLTLGDLTKALDGVGDRSHVIVVEGRLGLSEYPPGQLVSYSGDYTMHRGNAAVGRQTRRSGWLADHKGAARDRRHPVSVRAGTEMKGAFVRPRLGA